MDTLIVIALILIVISALIYFITKRYPEKDFLELSARVKLWWGMVAIFGLSTFIHPNISIVSLAFLSFFSLKEFFSITKARKNDRRIYIWAYLSIPLQYYWIWTDWYGMFIVFIPVYIFLFLPLVRISSGGTIGFLRSVSTTHWGLMLMVFGLSHLAFYTKATPEYGANLVLFLVCLTQLADVVHYMVSKTFGKKRLIPTANVNVTLEGYVVSTVLTAFAAAVLAPFLTPIPALFAFFIGVIIALGAFVGTMNISYVKRELSIDENNVIAPTKESFLSRIDSLSYTAPLFLHIIRYFFEWV